MSRDYTVHRLDPTGKEVERTEGLTAATATRRYTKNLRRHRDQHHIITKGTPLPQMPAKIIAEHFGGKVDR